MTITDDKPYLRCDDLPVSISTIRSLESRGPVTPEPCLIWLQGERVHLTADVSQVLTATTAVHGRTAGDYAAA
ncbi:hypothetical protein EAO68_01815 [Streptomyces sp. wa22]|nr:hypothetical protein EAO68_01815 [Streptomyces sp. wa22]